ncbi:Fic family protein, partial [Candidatus Roizmanbacteria bacterium]|nr:Fic family protein [Candidatus Roizmanbacteria bacterium]
FYRKNGKIEKYLQEIEICKKLIDLLPQLPSLEENIRRKSLLRSSVFSARIEGNRLTVEDFHLSSFINPKDRKKKEIFNILAALGWIYSSSPQKLTQDLILKLHQMVMRELSPEAGHFRTEVSAIFNQAGVAIYITPPPNQISGLVHEFIRFTTLSQHPGPITAALSHFAFEKIHPFMDGNGRVGRLLSTYILKNTNYHLRGLISLEEFFDNRKETYYDLLAQKSLDITDFVEFFLEGLVSQANKLLEDIKKSDRESPQDNLLPRRREILEIIKDHHVVSFDFIRRRFTQVASSTLHYDLSKLLKGGFIRKLGNTNGVLYTTSAKKI